MSTNVKKVKILGVVHDIEDVQARTDIGSIKNNISSLQNNMSTAQGNISSLKEDLNELKQNGTVVSGIEPMDDDIPKVFIDGEIPTSKTAVLARMKYVSKTLTFDAYLKIKCQGASSMSYPKKNFTVNIYSDEARETALEKLFKDWKNAESKFVLKANYIDHSHARNIVSANLWNDVVTSRSDYNSLPEELRNSPKNGAIDGFPIKLYTNGTYQGIYTWNIGKDAWMWNMDETNANHVLLCSETNTDGTYAENASNFRALWNGSDGSNWSIEVGTNSDALKISLNNLISFVMNNDGDNFKSGIGDYLDIQSAIDYYIHQYVICGLDGLAKNMLLATYDGTTWYCGAYDMDSTFGLFWNGSRFVSSDYACPEDYQEQFSLLWERIEENYVSELKARYAELRKTVYSLSNMVTKFERFMDRIGLDLYSEDLTIYTGIPSGSTNNIKQIRDYIRDRLVYVDGEFEDLGKILSSISATYTGGDITVGTPLTSLTGITVTGTYSDGTTAPITGYTLSGEIVEGENTITVSYRGLTTTLTVTGVAGSGGESGPSDIDYLTFTGTQYFDTGYVPKENSKFEIEGCFGKTKPHTCLFGANNYLKTMIGFNDQAISMNYKGAWIPAIAVDDPVGTYNHVVVAVDMASNTLTVAGKSYDIPDTTGTAEPSASMCIMRSSASSDPYMKGALYGFKIYESDTLVHDFIPAISGATPCLYDTVTGDYIFNAGTGELGTGAGEYTV